MLTIKVPADTGVLMVDDDPDFHFLLSRLFKRTLGAKIPFISAYSGEEGLEYLNNCLSTGKNLPGLVLMDVNMPGINGFETVSAVRENEILQELPIIIMLSSSSSERDVNSAIESGANDYYEKPMSIKDINFVAT